MKAIEEESDVSHSEASDGDQYVNDEAGSDTSDSDQNSPSEDVGEADAEREDGSPPAMEMDEEFPMPINDIVVAKCALITLLV